VNASVVPALFRAEIVKLRSTRTALGLLVAAVSLSVVHAILTVALMPRDFVKDSGVIIAAAFGLSVVPTLALVFGILGMTNEYRHGTITYTYLDTPKRWMVIAVKLVCYAAVGAGVMLLTGALVVLAIVVVAGIRGLPISAGQEATGIITAGNIALFIATAGLITAFGVGLGALFRAQVPTVAGALVWSLVIESLVVALKPSVGTFLPFTVFDQLTFAGESLGGEAVDLGLLSRPEAFCLSLAYIGIVSVLAVYISMRRDVTWRVSVGRRDTSA
jgi:hypothetical protein